jgi:hypothetical protein
MPIDLEVFHSRQPVETVENIRLHPNVEGDEWLGGGVSGTPLRVRGGGPRTCDWWRPLVCPEPNYAFFASCGEAPVREVGGTFSVAPDQEPSWWMRSCAPHEREGLGLRLASQRRYDT